MLVVDLSFLFVREYLVRFVDVVKLVHSIFIIWVLVGMILHRQLTIGLLDLTGSCILTHA
jgi:hypothetical protein